MLSTVGFESMDALITATVPPTIRRGEMNLPEAASEQEALLELKTTMDKNKVYRSHIGAGYHDCVTPPILLRNILENPAFYTPYTPYQAEISQGRLEMLLNFQTMVSDLTGLPVSNASLLDEATAAAEAMAMLKAANKKKSVFLVSSDCHPQTIAVCKTRSEGLGIELRVCNHTQFDLSDGDVFGVLVQYPATNGQIDDFSTLSTQVHEAGAKLAVAADLLSLTLLTPPGEWGADVVVGSSQRFGVPMGYGGPHAAFFSTTDAFKRKLPGRIIGVSRDTQGKPALRMAMQSREQHIRRDKASSNICTAQALLANVAQAYAVYHGPQGLVRIAERVTACAKAFAAGLDRLDIQIKTDRFFDTVHVDLEGDGNAQEYINACEEREINLRFINKNNLYVAFDETNSLDHVNELLDIFKTVKGSDVELPCASTLLDEDTPLISSKLARTSDFLTHPVFNSYHSETEMLRYLYKLQNKDLSLATAMIPLGSCTMKLNATSEMIPITWPTVGRLHPFAPLDQTAGYADMLVELTNWLAEVTGFYTVSLQPNSGAQGEYTGLRCIQAYHHSRGDHQRNISLIPTSAHGTNPASAVISGCKVVVVKCDSKGNIDVDDLKAKCAKYADNLSNLMVTYPSTHGVFEEAIIDIIDTVHAHGGLVYMDGANLNAQLGLCSPGGMGADVCHLNLHKTFCIPHGGGGPGMGPIGVNEKLAPFLPSHPMLPAASDTAMGAIAAAPFSSASILPITWMYMRMMGPDGLTKATETAILCANYMAARLRDHYTLLYQGANNTVAHEFIIDIRPLKAATGIVEEDIAKRLMDYNFHAPTMSFPVAGTLMVEPTESESLFELDRFCDAMIAIRAEIQAIEDGKVDMTNNVLKNSPHTADIVTADEWTLPYTRTEAAFPLPYLRENKFWPTVSRLDNVFGDRNVVCTCPPIEDYM